MGDITYNTLHKPGGWTEIQAARGETSHTPEEYAESDVGSWGGILAGREFTPRRPGLGKTGPKKHVRIVPLRWLTYGCRKRPVTGGSGGPLS